MTYLTLIRVSAFLDPTSPSKTGLGMVWTFVPFPVTIDSQRGTMDTLSWQLKCARLSSSSSFLVRSVEYKVMVTGSSTQFAHLHCPFLFFLSETMTQLLKIISNRSITVVPTTTPMMKQNVSAAEIKITDYIVKGGLSQSVTYSY